MPFSPADCILSGALFRMTSPVIPPSIITCDTCTPLGPYSLANPLATARKPNFADANAKKGERALSEAVAPVNTIVPVLCALNLAAASRPLTKPPKPVSYTHLTLPTKA